MDQVISMSGIKVNPVITCFSVMHQLEKEGFIINNNLELFISIHRHGFQSSVINKTVAFITTCMSGKLPANSETLAGYKFKVDTSTNMITIEIHKF